MEQSQLFYHLQPEHAEEPLVTQLRGSALICTHTWCQNLTRLTFLVWTGFKHSVIEIL